MFKTERLEFRQFTPEDLPLLIEQRSDPEVNRYLGGTKLQNPDALARRLEFYIGCYEKYGFGTCAMLWKQTGEMIGSAGIQPLAETDEIEVGYSIIKTSGDAASALKLRTGGLISGLPMPDSIASSPWQTRKILLRGV